MVPKPFVFKKIALKYGSRAEPEFIQKSHLAKGTAGD